jgi:integrase
MITRRSGSYGVAVYDKVLGRKRWIGTFGSLREAREAERAAAATPASRGTDDCASFADRWLRDYARDAPATRRTYEYGLKAFRQDFAGVRLCDVDKPTARRWARANPSSNARIVRTMFTDAINDGLHPGPNPFGNLRLEQSRGRRDLRALTEPELHELADRALTCHGDFGPTFRAVVLFAGYVGLRPGELFALERRDVSADEVHIRQNLDGTGQLKAPKNGLVRSVVLPPPARDALASVPPRLDLPWLFTTPRGRRLSKGSLHYYWRPVRAAFGRPEMDFYELRHFCATHLLEMGVAHADVAVQLGHTDGGALVMSTYGHPSEDAARERLKRAYGANVSRLNEARAGSQSGSPGS